VDLSDQLADQLKCGLCLNILDNPMDTHCKHTYCHECLKQSITSGIGGRKCPECRRSLTTGSRKRSRSDIDDNNVLIIGLKVVAQVNRTAKYIID
jgi:hypothetical protein